MNLLGEYVLNRLQLNLPYITHNDDIYCSSVMRRRRRCFFYNVLYFLLLMYFSYIGIFRLSLSLNLSFSMESPCRASTCNCRV